MKTLSLNKIVVLIALFFVAIAFSNSANALCVVDGNGAIVTVSGDSETPVKDDTGDDETAANTATDNCTITPDVYRLNFYKFGLCTADPDLNDLSSCQFFFEQAAGVEVDIQKDVSATLPIPEFYIEPNTYQYLYVQLSTKLGMKWSGRMTNAVDGSSGDGNGGTYCWTSNAGLHASTYVATNAHGSSLADSTQTMDCGTSEGTVVFSLRLGPCEGLGAHRQPRESPRCLKDDSNSPRILGETNHTRRWRGQRYRCVRSNGCHYES